MKRLKRIFNWIDNYFKTAAILAIGLFFFYHQFKKPNVDSPDDLLEVQGQVHEYSFQRVQAHRTTGNQYYIWLDNYPCTFQIKADFLHFFDKTRFEIDIEKGDILKMTIPREFESQLWDSSSHICIFSLEKYLHSYLSIEKTIPKEKSYFDLYAGLFFVSVGIIYYILKHRKKRRPNQTKL